MLSEQNKKLQESNEFRKNSVTKIISYFREHQRILKEKKTEEKEFTKLVYNGNKKEHKDRIYYFSDNHAPVYTKNALYVCNENEMGSFKHVIYKDNKFVALAPNDKSTKFNTENNFDKVRDLKTIKIGLAVSANLIISQNAGDCVINYLNNNLPIPVLAFKNTVNDLKQLHERRIYLRDIKPENTAYDGKQVNFIDIEDRIGIHKEMTDPSQRFDIYGEEVVITQKQITYDLINSLYTEKEKNSDELTLIQKDISQYLKVADEYAFLITMIATTTDNPDLKESTINPKTDAAGDQLRYDLNEKMNVYSKEKNMEEFYKKSADINNKYINPSVMYNENKNQFTLWLKENIKPENIKAVELLLTNPAEYAKMAPTTYLANMFLFNK